MGFVFWKLLMPLTPHLLFPVLLPLWLHGLSQQPSDCMSSWTPYCDKLLYDYETRSERKRHWYGYELPLPNACYCRRLKNL